MYLDNSELFRDVILKKALKIKRNYYMEIVSRIENVSGMYSIVCQNQMLAFIKSDEELDLDQLQKLCGIRDALIIKYDKFDNIDETEKKEMETLCQEANSIMSFNEFLKSEKAQMKEDERIIRDFLNGKPRMDLNLSSPYNIKYQSMASQLSAGVDLPVYLQRRAIVNQYIDETVANYNASFSEHMSNSKGISLTREQ